MVFKIAYWIGLAAEIAIRAPFERLRRSAARAERHVTTTERLLLGLLSLGGFVLPLVYSVTDWLRFADYVLPAWMGWLGVLLLGCAVLVFARAHRDLRNNWSPSLEVFQGHALITSGIYSRVRHPMYSSQWILAIAQLLLLQNWIAGPAGLVVFIPFYFLRVRAEEAMLLHTFGDQYRDYMRVTGAVFPRL